MNLRQRKALADARVSNRQLKAPAACGRFTSRTPFKAIYNWGPGYRNAPVGLAAYACRHVARWHFTPLRRRQLDVCWRHLMGELYADMDEVARTERWIARLERAGKL